MTKKIDWERMKTDLEKAMEKITMRIKDGSMDDLRERLALYLGTDEAERLLPREINKCYPFHQLSLELDSDSKVIYARLPHIMSAYESVFGREYHELRSSLPEKAGRLFSDIKNKVIEEAKQEGLKNGKQFISKHDNIILPFWFNHSSYLIQ